MITRRRTQAFTLIELLLVLVILAVLASVAVPLYTNQINKSRIQSTKALMSNVKQALETAHIDMGRFPSTDEGLDALVHRPASAGTWDGPYMDKVPVDGWGNFLGYRYPGTDDPASYDLWSMGPDGQDGTDDDIKKSDL